MKSKLQVTVGGKVSKVLTDATNAVASVRGERSDVALIRAMPNSVMYALNYGTEEAQAIQLLLLLVSRANSNGEFSISDAELAKLIQLHDVLVIVEIGRRAGIVESYSGSEYVDSGEPAELVFHDLSKGGTVTDTRSLELESASRLDAWLASVRQGEV